MVQSDMAKENALRLRWSPKKTIMCRDRALVPSTSGRGLDRRSTTPRLFANFRLSSLFSGHVWPSPGATQTSQHGGFLHFEPFVPFRGHTHSFFATKKHKRRKRKKRAGHANRPRRLVPADRFRWAQMRSPGDPRITSSHPRHPCHPWFKPSSASFTVYNP